MLLGGLRLAKSAKPLVASSRERLDDARSAQLRVGDPGLAVGRQILARHASLGGPDGGVEDVGIGGVEPTSRGSEAAGAAVTNGATMRPARGAASEGAKTLPAALQCQGFPFRPGISPSSQAHCSSGGGREIDVPRCAPFAVSTSSAPLLLARPT